MTLAEYLDATTEGPKPHRGMTGTESDWLPLTDFELRGRRLQFLESRVAGNGEEGVILPAPPGRYLMRGRERVGLEAECIPPRAPYPFDPL